MHSFYAALDFSRNRSVARVVVVARPCQLQRDAIGAASSRRAIYAGYSSDIIHGPVASAHVSMPLYLADALLIFTEDRRSVGEELNGSGSDVSMAWGPRPDPAASRLTTLRLNL